MRTILWACLLVGCGTAPTGFDSAAVDVGGSGSETSSSGGDTSSGGALIVEASGGASSGGETSSGGTVDEPDAAPVDAGSGGEASSGGTTSTGGTQGSGGGPYVDPTAPFELPGCPGWKAYRIAPYTCLYPNTAFRTTTVAACAGEGQPKACVNYTADADERIVLFKPIAVAEPFAVRRGDLSKCQEREEVCAHVCDWTQTTYTPEMCVP